MYKLWPVSIDRGDKSVGPGRIISVDQACLRLRERNTTKLVLDLTSEGIAFSLLITPKDYFFYMRTVLAELCIVLYVWSW